MTLVSFAFICADGETYDVPGSIRTPACCGCGASLRSGQKCRKIKRLSSVEMSEAVLGHWFTRF